MRLVMMRIHVDVDGFPPVLDLFILRALRCVFITGREVLDSQVSN